MAKDDATDESRAGGEPEQATEGADAQDQSETVGAEQPDAADTVEADGAGDDADLDAEPADVEADPDPDPDPDPDAEPAEVEADPAADAEPADVEGDPAADAEPAEVEADPDPDAEPADVEGNPDPDAEPATVADDAEASAEPTQGEQDGTPVEPESPILEDAPTRELDAVEPDAVEPAPPVEPDPPVAPAPPERTAVLHRPERSAAAPERSGDSPQRTPAPSQRPVPAPRPQRPAEPSPAHPLEVFDGAERPRRRTGRVLGGIAAVLVVVAGAYVAASWALADRVPRGVTVAGVDIGGQSADVAVATLSEELRSVASEPIVVTAGERSVTLDPAQSGLSFDADATVANLTGFTLEPARLWQHLFGLGEQPPVTRVDTETLETSITAVASALLTEPVDGRIVFADGAAHATPAEDGTAVDESAASEVLARTWLTAPRPVALPTVAVAPTITQDETDRAMSRLAKPLASGPVGVVVEEQVAELPADVVTESAVIVPEGSQLVLRLDGEQLVDEVLKRTRDLLSDAKDASFEFVDGKPRIVPGTAGTWLDPEHVATAVRNAALGSPRTANLLLSEVDPEQTTNALEELGITELVSTFSTSITSDRARNANLERGAELVAGVLVRPDEVFSLNETIGPITAENGYVNSGVVVNGVLQDGMGGGLSQMGTTMFNAGYFAGFEDVEHRPHSYWFSRYPEGREATIYEGLLDVKWRNTTPYGALLNSYVANGSLHVEVWGTKHFEVETSKSGRSRITAPTTRYNTQAGCISQRAGNPGFEVTNTRVVLLEGEEVERTSYTWRYNPQDAIVCGSPPSDDEDDD